MIARPQDRDLERAELEDVARRLAAAPALWEHLVRHDPEARVYEELLRDNHLAVWLICWMDDHDTGFHDHDRSAGAVAVRRRRRGRGPAAARTARRRRGAFGAGAVVHASRRRTSTACATAAAGRR